MEAISEKIRYSLSYRIRDTSQNHTPGEKGFVDWAGRTIPIQDPVTGEVRGAALFVMVLGASSYTMPKPHWISRWLPGSAATSTPLNIFRPCRSCWFQITREPV